MTISGLQPAQYRLAQHYLGKLRTASEAVRLGRASLAYGLRLFDQEWEQIKNWQHWASNQPNAPQGVAVLCKEFILAGADLLQIRQSPIERVVWLESALKASTYLQDVEAEYEILFQLFYAHYSLNALDTAEFYAKHLFEAAQTTHHRLYYGRAIFAIGCIQEERGRYAEARQSYKESLAIFEALKAGLDIGSALNGLGAVALYLGEFKTAHDHFVHHLAIAESLGRKVDICRALLAISEGLWGLEDFAGSELYAQRAMALSKALGHQRMLGGALLKIAGCAVEQNKLEEACVAYAEGLQVARSSGAEQNVIYGLSSLGYVEFRLGRYTEALAHCSESLEMARLAKQPRFMGNALRNMANIHLMMGDLAPAQHELYEALRLAQSLNSDFQKIRILCTAVWLWQRQGLLEQAAIWAGLLVDKSEIDVPVFQPVFVELEIALGYQHYHHALAQGKKLNLDTVVAEVLKSLETLTQTIPLG
jgi:tetratricopeptide (TPR) repeat protein